MINDEEFLALFTSEDGRLDTGDLQFYDDFAQKKELFGTYVKFDSSTQFMHFVNRELPELLGEQTAVYRGLSSGRYRLFNKAQRAFITSGRNDPKDEKSYHAGISALINNARSVNNCVLPKFFKATGLKDSHLSILSFLQHYGSPTPFMDWTTDPFVALFFAIMSMTNTEIDNYHMGPVDRGIEDYFSLNILIKDQALNQFNEFKQLRSTKSGSIEHARLKKKKFQFIEEMYKSGKPSFSLVNNLHIVNQKGLFIYNSSTFGRGFLQTLESLLFNEYGIRAKNTTVTAHLYRYT